MSRRIYQIVRFFIEIDQHTCRKNFHLDHKQEMLQQHDCIQIGIGRTFPSKIDEEINY